MDLYNETRSAVFHGKDKYIFSTDYTNYTDYTDSTDYTDYTDKNK